VLCAATQSVQQLFSLAEHLRHLLVGLRWRPLKDRRLCIAADRRGTRSSELKSREKAFHECHSREHSLDQTETPIRECTQSGMDAGCNLDVRAGFRS
jgi:hypothetical protein